MRRRKINLTKTKVIRQFCESYILFVKYIPLNLYKKFFCSFNLALSAIFTIILKKIQNYFTLVTLIGFIE